MHERYITLKIQFYDIRASETQRNANPKIWSSFYIQETKLWDQNHKNLQTSLDLYKRIIKVIALYLKKHAKVKETHDIQDTSPNKSLIV